MALPLTGQDLKNKFLRCEALVNENRVQVPEALKMKLYGLGKQIKEGDCKMPQPPLSNPVLRGKWDAWTNCAGMSIEKSMQEYTNLVDSLEPSARRSPSISAGGASNSTSTKITAAPVQHDAPVSVRKQGTLYKQRDLFKGWRPRHFVLQDNFLHYYLEPDDPVPRNTLDLTGCSITTTKSVTVDGVEYFPFVITHPKSKTPYHLSSDSKLDADTWVAKLIEAANIPAAQPMIVSASDTESRRPLIDSANETRQAYFDKNVEHDLETRMYIPPEHLQRVEKSAQLLVEKLTTNNDANGGWELLFEKNGLIAKKKTGSIMCVKAEIVLPYNIFDVFAMLINPKKQTELDSQRLEQVQIKEFSNHTWVDYIRFKGVWPTSPRDFVNIAHWRLLKDGRIVISAYSEKFDDIKPPVDGHVRAETLLGGFVLTPVSEGTQVLYLVETDLKGSLPASVVNLAANSQPMLLSSLKTVMDRDRKRGANKRALNVPADYAELVSFTANCLYESKPSATDAKSTTVIDDSDRVTSSSSSSTTASTTSASATSSSTPSTAPAVPIQRKASLLKMASKIPAVNTAGLMMLFLPVLLYYVVDSKWRSVAFLAGLTVSMRYLFHKHLGKAIVKIPASQVQRQLPGGKFVFRFPIELGRLLVALNEKRTEFELEMTITHMVAKACAMAINEFPALNGHIVMDQFYRANSSANANTAVASSAASAAASSSTAGVDISVAVSVNDIQSVTVKICDADLKPVEFIANELIECSKSIRSGGDNDASQSKIIEKLTALLPASALLSLKKALYEISSQYGISIPLLGVTAFPLGVCTIIPAHSDGEVDLDMTLIADTQESSAPITVTLGGMRIVPNMDVDRKIAGSPALNVAVAIDSRAATAGEGKRFVARLQEFVNDPSILQAAHDKLIFAKEEAAKRKQFFGK